MGYGMKRIFLTPLTAVETTDKEGVGTLRWEGNKCYKWCLVKNTTATVALVAGDPVGYDKEDGHSNSHVVGDMNDADSAPILAGVVGAAIAGVLATSYYAWVQIKGAATTTETLGGTAADGNALILSTTDKTLTKSTAAVDAVHALAMDASAKTIILDCPF